MIEDRDLVGADFREGGDDEGDESDVGGKEGEPGVQLHRPDPGGDAHRQKGEERAEPGGRSQADPGAERYHDVEDVGRHERRSPLGGPVPG